MKCLLLLPNFFKASDEGKPGDANFGKVVPICTMLVFPAHYLWWKKLTITGGSKLAYL